MEHYIKEIDLLKNHKLYISYDAFPDSPDDNGNTDIFLVYDHRQFYIKRKGYEPKDIYDYLNDVINNSIEEGVNNKYENYFIFPVFAYIHSGVSLSLTHQGCRFDVSCTGYILVDKNDVDFDLQRKNSKELQDKTDEEIARYYAEGLIKQWNQYLSGDIYFIEVKKKRQYLKVYFPLPKEENLLEVINNSTVNTEEESVLTISNFYDFKSILEYIDEELLNETIKQQIIE